MATSASRQTARILAAGLIAAAACLGVGGGVGCGGGGAGNSAGDRAKAIGEAQTAYKQVVANAVDLSNGPCIAENLPGLPDWVADLAHDPRKPVDDVAANQCQRFLSGDAHHFVELDLDGKLIRAQ